MHSPSPGDRNPGRSGRFWEGAGRERHRSPRKRWRFFWLFVLLLVTAFCIPLIELVRYSMREELHSHVVLIPFVTAYLVYARRELLPSTLRESPGLAMIPLAVGIAALVLSWSSWARGLSPNDALGLMAVSFLGFFLAGVLGILGAKWAAAAAFPLFFLVFMIPLPDGLVVLIERGLMVASADVAALMFSITGTPFFRTGQVFELPGIVLEIARECSGIRSSWVLLMTSFLASYMLLKSPWRRGLLIALVIPLGIFRNGLRILVIGWLCVHLGPHMIDSPVHRSGGPWFFALSLVPLFLVLWWLRRGEGKPRNPGREHPGPAGRGDSQAAT